MAKSKSAAAGKSAGKPAAKSAGKTGSSPRRRATSRKSVPTTSRRLWLSYPPEHIKEPVIWQMSQRFPIVFDIRQASVTDKIGILCLELEGQSKDVEAAITWLRKTGVRVEPVELSALES